MNDPELTQLLLDWSTIFVRLSMHDFNRFARGGGLSLAQMSVLMHLHYNGPREVMGFADLMQVSPAGASQMIERLVQSGLVQRIESRDDRRVRQVHLTEQGRAGGADKHLGAPAVGRVVDRAASGRAARRHRAGVTGAH